MSTNEEQFFVSIEKREASLAKKLADLIQVYKQSNQHLKTYLDEKLVEMNEQIVFLKHEIQLLKTQTQSGGKPALIQRFEDEPFHALTPSEWKKFQNRNPRELLDEDEEIEKELLDEDLKELKELREEAEREVRELEQKQSAESNRAEKHFPSNSNFEEWNVNEEMEIEKPHSEELIESEKEVRNFFNQKVWEEQHQARARAAIEKALESMTTAAEPLPSDDEVKNFKLSAAEEYVENESREQTRFIDLSPQLQQIILNSQPNERYSYKKFEEKFHLTNEHARKIVSVFRSNGWILDEGTERPKFFILKSKN